MNLIKINEQKFNVVIDLKYASSNNILGKKIYRENICLLHQAAAAKLFKAAEIALSMGLKIKIFDAYRPKYVQQALWDFNPNPNFLSDPKKGSPHTRGIAVDLTLINKKNIELDMGTNFDDFTEKALHLSDNISLKVRKNRCILLSIMTLAGFDFYHNEWWHYQLFNSKNYELINSFNFNY